MSKAKTETKMDSFQSWAHRWGRVGTLIALIYMVALPFVVLAAYDSIPSLGEVFNVNTFSILLIYIPVGFSEALSYTPILGCSAYLAFITGNIMNLKLPVAANAMNLTKKQPNTPEGEAIASVAVAVSSLMTVAILTLAAVCASFISPVFELPAVKTASGYLLPALFGSMALAIGYTVVMGWIFKYMVGTFTGATLAPDSVDGFSGSFGAMASAFGNNGWQIVALVLTFACIHTKDDYLFYGVTTIFAASASNVMNFINVRKYITLKPLRNYDFKHHMKPILIFFGMSVATTIYTNLDTVMLKFMQGNEAAGYYTAAVKVKTVLVGVVTSIGTVLLPRVSYYIEQKRHDEFRKVTAKAMELVVMMALPLVVYFIIYAREAILVLSGADYMPAIIPMQIIMPTVFLIGFTNITGIQILIPQGRENVVLVSEIVGAVVDFAINLVLIPSMGSSGAAIGTLVAELAVLIVQAIAMWKFLMEIMRKIKAGKIVLACVLGTVVALLVHLLPITNSFMILVITALLFFGIYGGGLLLMKEPLVYEVVGQMKEKFLKK